MVPAARAAVVVGLLSLLPACSKKEAARSDAGPAVSTSAPDAAPRPPADLAPLPPAHPVARRRVSVVELVVLTAHPAAELAAISRGAVARLLRSEHCGDEDACARTRAFVADPATFSVEAHAVADVALPAADTLETGAPTLDLAARTRALASPRAMLIRARGPASPGQMPARSAFAAAAALASKLEGHVLDTTALRLETPGSFADLALRARFDAQRGWFRPAHVRVELERQEDGTARITTSGLARFGAPDLEIAGAPMTAARDLGAVVALLAQRLAEGEATAPVALEGGVRVDLAAVPMKSGDADNAFVRVVPTGGATAQGYLALLADLAKGGGHAEIRAGDAGAVRGVRNPDAFEAASARARAALVPVLARFEGERAKGAVLLVKLPFSRPGASEVAEWMWIEVTAADAQTIEGTLANEPVALPALARGQPVKRARREVADFLVTWPDGTREGGETERALDRENP